MATAEPVLQTLNREEARTAGALLERMFPADAGGLGAAEIGVLAYLNRAPAGARKRLRIMPVSMFARSSTAGPGRPRR